MQFPIGKKLFHLVVNSGTSLCLTVDLELVQTTRNVMEHDIPFGNSNRENGPTFLDFPLFLGIFQWDEPTKRVRTCSIYLRTGNSGNGLPATLQPRPQSPGDEVEVKVTGRLEDLRALTRLNSHKLATALISKAFRYEGKVRNQ